ncbi:MAG: TIGR04076 family protein [Promethearchaeota archaeon]
MTYDLIITAKKITGKCPVYKENWKTVICGPHIDLEKSDAACIHALSCLSTFSVALRDGIPPSSVGLAKEGKEEVAYFQCLDPGPPYTDGGTVLFEVKRVLCDGKEK